MSKVRFKEQKEDQFIYIRNVIVAYPPEYLSVNEERVIIVTQIDDNEGNYQFEIQYSGAVTHLDFDSTVRDFPTIPEIESFCAGVDAGYESIFDFIPEDLNGYTFQKLQSEFLSRLKGTITNEFN